MGADDADLTEEMMRLAIRLAKCMGLVAVYCLLSSNAAAQYLFLDSNCDSTNTTDDVVVTIGTPTSVDVWLVTNRNRDGSTASCSTGSDSLTVNSYEFILRAVGGGVAYTNITNHMAAEMPTSFGSNQDSTDLYIGFGGSAALSPGRYLLCSLQITATSGNPTVDIATSTPLAGSYQTSFGSRCAGVDGDNTIKYGLDWFDVDGLYAGGGMALAMNIPPESTTPVGQAIDVSATVIGGSESVTLEALNTPPGASTSFADGGRTAQIHWVPLNSDAGSHTILFRAEDGLSSTEQSATIVVPSTGSASELYASEFIRFLAEVGPNSGNPRIDVVDGEERVAVFLSSSATTEELAARGIEVGSRDGDRMTASCVRDSLASILLSVDISAIFEPPLVRLAMDKSAVSAGVDGLRMHANGAQIQGAAGQGAVVGIVDSGIEAGHPDFKNYDGTSRILGYWDQSPVCAPCPGLAPTAQGYFYGREWTPAPSESLYRRASAYSKDIIGHGTHVAGIAAGNANYDTLCSSRRYMGVAPRADIIAVKLKPSALSADAYPATEIVEAVDYVFKKAKSLNKRAVVNLSLTSQYGPHDGSSAFEQILNAKVTSAGPGYIVVAAAGNDGTNDLHGIADARSSIKNAILFDVPEHDPYNAGGYDSLEVYAWFDRDDSVAVLVLSPNDTYSLGPVSFPPEPDSPDFTDRKSTPHGYITVHIGNVEDQWPPVYGPTPPFGARIAVRAPTLGRIEPGTWTLRFTPRSTGSITGDGRVDAYLVRRRVGAPVEFVRMTNQPTSDEAIGSPATSDSVIAVGAYVTNDCWQTPIGVTVCKSLGPGVEGTYYYSSHGPRRDGVMKPDLVAPGASIVSALSWAAGLADSFLVHGGGYAVLDGTSLAAPHVSGVVALLLADSSYSVAGMRQRLQATTRKELPLMGSTPNKIWGAGKLDARHALGNARFALELTSPPAGKSYYGNAGIQESLAVRVTGGATTSGVSFHLVPGAWCYGDSVLLGSTPALSDSQSYVFHFTIPNTFIGDIIRIRASTSGGLFAGRSAWTRYQHPVLSITGATEDAGDGTIRFGLRLGSANPASNGFGFRAAVPRAGGVTVRVYSVGGRMVWQRRIEVQLPGEVRFAWDGRDLTGRRVGSGVYLMKATTGRESVVRKLVVIR